MGPARRRAHGDTPRYLPSSDTARARHRAFESDRPVLRRRRAGLRNRVRSRHAVTCRHLERECGVRLEERPVQPLYRVGPGLGHTSPAWTGWDPATCPTLRQEKGCCGPSLAYTDGSTGRDKGLPSGCAAIITGVGPAAAADRVCRVPRRRSVGIGPWPRPARWLRWERLRRRQVYWCRGLEWRWGQGS